jgi:16S rRNA U516 pseudouridylate synthase RsuA-like enzyme
VQEGPLSLGNLKPGQYRPLTDVELHAIFEEIQK